MSHEFRLSNEDDFLPEDEQQSASRLSSEPRKDSLEQRLSIVDHLLTTAPMLAPGIDLAERVLEAIQEQERKFNRNAGTGLALGLALVVIIVMALVTSLATGLLAVLLNWTAVYQTLIYTGGEVAGFVSSLAAALTTATAETPYASMLAVASIPMLFLWMWLMRRLTPTEKSS